MFRMSKQADYAIVLLSHFALREGGGSLSAKDLAERAGLPLPTVAKILKQLTRGGLLVSQRGAGGGYSLAQRTSEVSVARILDVMEEKVGLVECSPGVMGACSHQKCCPTKDPLTRLNDVVVTALEGVSLHELVASA